MTAEEQIGQLQTENQSLREQLAEALEQLGQALGGSMNSKGSWPKTATIAASPRRAMAPGESVGASSAQARRRREGSQGMLDVV